jgi:hypothetical protein
MFIAVLFTLSKLWKYPRCPATDELVKKMWYKYTVMCYLAIRKNEIMMFAGKWMELENIMLSNVIKELRLKDQKLNVFPHKWKLDI